MSISSHNATSDLPSFAPPLTALSEAAHPRVIEITERLFGGPASIRVEDDPEFPSQYFVVTTPASGDTHELVSKVDDWHRTIRAALGDGISDYRLMVDPR
ncbi:MAG: hypothetical protein L0211_02885 [Planctomycetaceae bacterium]|nr:hypothetical protein [Planctomycetaceae bacterium]